MQHVRVKLSLKPSADVAFDFFQNLANIATSI